MWGFIDTLYFVLVIILPKVLYRYLGKGFSIFYLISLLIFLLSRNMFVDKTIIAQLKPNNTKTLSSCFK